MKDLKNTYAKTVLELLQLLASLDKQIQYARNVPAINVPAELVCMWFDDCYHPDTDLFREAFTTDAVKLLKDFHDFYSARKGLLPDTRDINELHQSSVWLEVVAEATSTLSKLQDKIIAGHENIMTLLSIFHDGMITEHSFENGNLNLTVEISYLATRINPSYSKFQLALKNVRKMEFHTWQKDQSEPSRIVTDAEKIFRPELEILSAKTCDDKIELALNQDSVECDYCGGDLVLQVESAVVMDEAGKEYSLSAIKKICEEYWEK